MGLPSLWPRLFQLNLRLQVRLVGEPTWAKKLRVRVFQAIAWCWSITPNFSNTGATNPRRTIITLMRSGAT
jgi:hypothetical protein